jgi:hypothetical protein
MDLPGRIKKLEDAPDNEDVVLHLADGGRFSYRGTALEFFSETLEQHSQGGGPLVDATVATVAMAGGCKLHEILQALIAGPVPAPRPAETELQ